ncbi:hypothetical protein SEVIR_1G321000v4 [Setaria viridis]|uniref:Uncharacterized protein n=1 Tax=Setaria viridis TaxID=4556 RepID=A0A4U6WF84_SETVI|nr:hypothetical protein SEVIR_1G321000v2 [Setaria viridis]
MAASFVRGDAVVAPSFSPHRASKNRSRSSSPLQLDFCPQANQIIPFRLIFYSNPGSCGATFLVSHSFMLPPMKQIAAPSIPPMAKHDSSSSGVVGEDGSGRHAPCGARLRLGGTAQVRPDELEGGAGAVSRTR